jgi:isopentenyl-diphosphate delta-isomerase
MNSGPNLSDMADEQLILVDERNHAVGTGGKDVIHRKGLLHRAFSIFLADAQGQIVLQQRSRQKYHSGGLWANTCCGHPRPGERTVSAARRRLHEELGVSATLSFGFFSRYRADLDHGMQENEYVYVFFGRLRGEPRPDPAEVAAVQSLPLDEIKRRIGKNPQSFTYWLRHYLEHHLADIARHVDKAARSRKQR